MVSSYYIERIILEYIPRNEKNANKFNKDQAWKLSANMDAND